MCCAPNIGIGTVRLFCARTIGKFVARQKLTHLGSTTKFGDELFVEPWFINTQGWVNHEAVAIKTFDVIAFVGTAVAPDIDTVFLHCAHKERSGDGATKGRCIEIGSTRSCDVECTALQCN